MFSVLVIMEEYFAPMNQIISLNEVEIQVADNQFPRIIQFVIENMDYVMHILKR